MEIHRLIVHQLRVCVVFHLRGGNTPCDFADTVVVIGDLLGIHHPVVNIFGGSRDPVYFIRFGEMRLKVGPYFIYHVETIPFEDGDGETSCHLDLNQGLVEHLLYLVSW